MDKTVLAPICILFNERTDQRYYSCGHHFYFDGNHCLYKWSNAAFSQRSQTASTDVIGVITYIAISKLARIEELDTVYQLTKTVLQKLRKRRKA